MSDIPFVVGLDRVEIPAENLRVGDPVLLTEGTDYVSGASWWRANCDLGLLGYIKGDNARRLSFRVKAQGAPRATIAELSPNLTLGISFHESAVPSAARYEPPSTRGLMVGGFLRGIVATILKVVGVGFLLIWIFSGFYSPTALIIAIVLFVVGSFLSYVSRHTVKT